MRESFMALSKQSDPVSKLDHSVKQKRKTRWDSGVCSLCGQWVDMITQEHAHRHGFKNADDMARAGIIK